MCKCWAHVSFSHCVLHLAHSNYFVNEFPLSIAIRFRASHAVRVHVRIVHVSEVEGFGLISQNSQFLDSAGSPIILTQESGYYLGSC